MRPFKSTLLESALIPAALVLTAGAAAVTIATAVASRPALSACAPCNPCAAKNPCNPCAAKNPINPCAAANPCNPCAASAAAVASGCVVPRLANAAKAVTGNPCAAQNPCNPCSAANPCNPCAAVNPCNPCAAANPCNPCSAKETPELTHAEAVAAYDCILDEMRAGYRKSGNETAVRYVEWRRYSIAPYRAATHGNRYVQNYANPTARAYGAFENAGVMPAGSVLAKDSFAVGDNGRVSAGPLFIMEKMTSGFNASSGNWKYTMIMPSGAVFGETRGKNSAAVEFCAECHAAVADEQDHMMFLPEEYRVR